MLKTILKIIAVLICLLAVVDPFGRSCAEAKTFQYAKTIQFDIPAPVRVIEYNDKTYLQAAFHYTACTDAIKLTKIYFKGLDPEFDFDNYTITIKIIYDHPNHLFGTYDWSIKTIRVQPFAVTGNDRYILFDRAVTYREYVALLAHEISHAVLHQRNNYSDRAAHEYFAWIVTFDIAHKELIEHASKLHEARGFDTSLGINATYHDFAPEKFAVRSYWHREKDNWKVFYQIWDGQFESYKLPGMEG